MKDKWYCRFLGNRLKLLRIFTICQKKKIRKSVYYNTSSQACKVLGAFENNQNIRFADQKSLSIQTYTSGIATTKTFHKEKKT